MFRIAAVAVAAAIGAIALGGAAQAADLYRGAAPYTVKAPLGVYSWAGPYLGVNLGYQWGEITNNLAEPHGVNGGAQAGYNWQSGQFVFGGEIDLQVSGAEDTFAAWQFSNPWFGTLRGRVGYAMNNILLYGTGGLAFGSVRGEVVGLSESHASLGWTIGLGAEVGLTPNWSAKAEYLYVDLSDRSFGVTGARNGYEFGVLRLGVNYRF